MKALLEQHRSRCNNSNLSTDYLTLAQFTQIIDPAFEFIERILTKSLVIADFKSFSNILEGIYHAARESDDSEGAPSQV